MKNKFKLISTSHHRNGICGASFNVSLFQDEDGTQKVFVDFGGTDYAVLQTDLMAKGDIAFGSNSWRGDHYADAVRELAKNHEPAISDKGLVFFINHGVKTT